MTLLSADCRRVADEWRQQRVHADQFDVLVGLAAKTQFYRGICKGERSTRDERFEGFWKRAVCACVRF